MGNCSIRHLFYCVNSRIMNKDILDLGRETIGKTVKGLRTINRFIKLFNSMPEEVRQDFYRKMAAKIKDDDKIKKYHVHIYRISDKLELSTLARSEKGAKEGALSAAESGAFAFGKSDCKHIAIAFLEKKKPDYSGAKITHRPPDRKPADLYDKK